jgi:hypothetical protein
VCASIYQIVTKEESKEKTNLKKNLVVETFHFLFFLNYVSQNNLKFRLILIKMIIK